MNLPNALAFLRIVFAPLLFFLLTHSFEGIHQSWINYFAALTFSLAALSDFFDGYIARTWEQITKLGSILDPLADKMLILAAFIGLLIMGRVNEWIIYIILVREFFITGFRVVMISENLDISASFAGKLKTGFQMVAIGFLIMEWPFAQILLYIALILTLYSGYEYIYAYIKGKK
ncbi:CDP-diacylglycerol--glycerol-3-phosphate 3-phosphatidyltransferase [Campylobacter novaezeelandiae]|uniref:CDP-diacylglycerol--glycerol-3-phosphate 3-phosphatidyltransferase n=1 Tax=Campylobacter novaezeelandiae TaxID=2267891 RepID=A0A4Q9JUN1_9BACT|nr:CDP-diacylglycerol--glycerol-3-phosphate 3-phosphatidyltransferase [Campylobacter novaezeelandiae]MBK1964016.1 CDP-diacylglycerol--glycerol-3-phosphate 3-phosphatidyltransferase [Campylobacter novaezeelandiae]MBK1993742.1 CDP-diacylglycerol--glycerol-3-phosphate 3-phosphatidyltransferase [Campylobacter novaezeelandiae]QWU80358.1 phosphatidylglycerophosphate synthase [Campylobacter novaezeelandiae]TBR80101.1 CDP-diacylglycerol--glycerol-3-phosphate 3-phosphatidyltransferase [Campylobacter nov